MTPFVKEILVRCRVRETARVAEALTSLGWGTQWIEEPLVQDTDRNGYVLHATDPDADATVHAWPTRDTDSPAVPVGVLGFSVEPVCAASDVDAEAAVDWNVAWREAHAPRIEIAGGWSLVAPWAERIPGERAIVVEPGGAFGTGAHPTTRDVLAMLQQYVHAGDSVIDLGTGSGVLAIAAVIWGAGVVHAVDCEPSTREQVAGNAVLNDLAPDRIEVTVADITETIAQPRTWDIVLCNVGAEEIERILPRATEIISPDGVLVASGIWDLARERIEARAAALRLHMIDVRSGERWVTIAFARTAKLRR